ncbi:uncharacterized protein LOC117167143 isoform X2 [Belonocnema kinseyi]|uniref:uncharacterized protein LOC117167143 isoform X2 n=1 Tax=Belonocnema kinseyi TaxID=2817044 RepID=UPI00143D588A|nr:uncharacterized protein LOC117167143 isoform X2 [Belonocnema kinseyi]
MRIISCYIRRIIIAAFVAAFVYCIVQVLRSELKFNDTDPPQLEKLDGAPACKFPDLDILNPEIMKFIKEVKPLNCKPEDWVVVDGSKLQIAKSAKEINGQITCAFSEIVRVDDFKVRLTKAVESDDCYILKESDFADVRCESRTGKQWHSVLAGVKRDLPVKLSVTWDKVPEKALKLNVLLFGFDSLSRNTFIRKLPRSYRYLKQNLDSLVLEGYNIVGDGTPQALIPILTGKIELELPETRKRMGMKANYVDIFPLIWQKYKDSGYITGFMEDVHHIGTFTYRLKGFKKQPTDHYMRTFYLAAEPLFRYSQKFCLNGVPRHSVMMNYIKTIFDAYKDQPKFIFGFHGELSHDSYNDIGAADEDVYHWIKSLNSSGHLNNTILIVMSDHGHRFAAIRNTVQGKQEERLPFFSFTFPPWFKQVYPRAYANFVYNTQHLTTPFDIHRTIEKVLDFKTPKEGDVRERAISLFDKVPLDRTCADAFIEPHWCACLNWQEISVSHPTIVAAANHFVKILNSYTEDHRNICSKLQLRDILWAAKLTPTKGLLNFQKSGDQDGFVGDFSAKTEITSEMYQLKVKTDPSGGIFEASITYDVKNNVFSLKISDISRINMYGSQARCVENHLYDLRKYCYCRD